MDPLFHRILQVSCFQVLNKLLPSATLFSSFFLSSVFGFLTPETLTVPVQQRILLKSEDMNPCLMGLRGHLGSVVSWGWSHAGGDSRHVQEELGRAQLSNAVLQYRSEEVVFG